MSHGSVVILLTPPGAAAIAVVRLIGPRLSEFLQRHFSRPALPGRCVHGELRDGDRVIDDPVVVLAPDGSFADVNLHGGPWVVSSFLELAQREGFELLPSALPLDERAVDADTPIEREVLTHLPLARTDQAIRVLLAQPRAWEKLTCQGASRDRIESILNDRSMHWLLFPPLVAIIGAPNVGKSTLANQLFAQQRSITADVPGTTRDWVGEIANIDGLAVMLVDTPGVRETSDPIERLAIERSGGEVRRAELVILVIDASRPLEPDQRRLLDEHPGSLRVLNKIDKRLPDLDVPDAIRTVATTGQGVDDLRRAIRKRFGCENFDELRPRCWTARQRGFLSTLLRTA